MDFVVIGFDKPGDLRKRLRAAHLEYVRDTQDRFKFGGPLIAEDGRVLGSLLILTFPTRVALEDHLAEDPYVKGGLFESVRIHETRQIVPEASPGALAQEIARQKAESK
ncbi:MAG: hypothetical protein EXQ86_05125 [Rhodospirillales bacterium]|nr:hypothetical protein [Rhodospirillales bacterium]